MQAIINYDCKIIIDLFIWRSEKEIFVCLRGWKGNFYTIRSKKLGTQWELKATIIQCLVF